MLFGVFPCLSLELFQGPPPFGANSAFLAVKNTNAPFQDGLGMENVSRPMFTFMMAATNPIDIR
jgi:hypothetical protein